MSTTNDNQKHWQPPVSPKQLALIKDPSQLILADGPRLSSKTIGILHKLCKHLWFTPAATAMIVGRTITKNLNEGAWTDLIKSVMPCWIKAGFGMQYLKEPRMEPVTHRYYFDVTNRFYDDPDSPFYGQPSRCYLDSLPDERDVEEKYKGKRFSFIYMTELSDFKYRKTVDAFLECLRVVDPKQDKLTIKQVVCDTNPAEEGEDSWIWDLWYWFRTVDLNNLNDDEKERLGMKDIGPEETKAMLASLKTLQLQLSLHHFTLDDNPYITEAQRQAQRGRYAYSQDLLDRYFYGKWTKATGEGIFSSVWRPVIHVIGRARGVMRAEAEVMAPEESTQELGGGWDMGGINAAVALIEKVIVEVDFNGTAVEKTGFKILDEFVNLGQAISLEDVAGEVLEKMDFWEELLGRHVLWRHWSDQSSLSSFQNIAKSTEAREILRISQGKIMLRGFKKLHGSVQQRVDLITRMLHENRIFVSAARCPAIIEMFDRLKKNKRGTIDRASIYKHAFDAISYYIAMECWHEISASSFSQKHRQSTGANRVITMKL